jgi:transcriptional regulator with XRE-family HTH domain
MDILAKRLKWLREKERYSQKDIAKKIGMTPSGYQKIEYGERDPKLDVIVTLCDIFNVSADFLLGRVNFIEELSYCYHEIDRIEQKIKVIKNESSLSIRKITELRNKMIESANAYGITHEKTIRFSQELDEKISEQSDILVRIDDLEHEKRIIILEYIKKLQQIPESKPLHDKLISQYAPFKITIQMNIFEEFELLLSGEGIGNLGTVAFFKSEEDALIKEETLLKWLNNK